MKTLYNYILLSAIAVMFTCCVKEQFEQNRPFAETGDEVKFGLSLSDPKTKTVYGDETTVNGKPVFPIYWVEGDKVQVFSPQCLEGRRSAEYKVVLPSGVDKPYYAKDLTRTGEYGVQWGENPTADFYSLYPSGNYTLSSDGSKAENITINSAQNIVVNGDNVKSDMEDCLMYAKTTGVEKGDTVKLHYDPISTVVMLTLKVAANEQGTEADAFTVQTISLTADTAIAGTFSLNIADGTFGEFANGNTAKKITTQIVNNATGGFHTLGNKQSVTVPLFLAPAEYTSVKSWKVEVVANNKTYTKTLGIDKKLEPGQIHKITLPELKPDATEWDVSKWMTYIPRNVYLSEVSIPGTWNSLNSDCQSNTSISEQYKIGVRAFHLDTRWKASRNGFLGQISNPSITGLSVCDGSTSYSVLGESGRVNGTAAQTFESCLNSITENVKGDEYMVVFCTFAQDSYNGGNCPSTWQAAVSNACASNDKVYDANNLSANTLVGDVLGKVIVIANLDTDVDSATLPESSKCIFTYVPMNLPANHYETTTSHTDDLYNSAKALTGISMYTSHAQISTTGTSSVNCGDRGYSHPLTNRDALITSFWDWSKGNYGTTNYKHDKWIYLGLGGYIMTSSSSSGSGYDTIENRYAPMIYDRINEMGINNVPYYPVGILLMNNKKGSNYTSTAGVDLGYNFKEVCKQILMLNNKYRLQYDKTKPSDYNPAALSVSNYDATATVGGNAF